MGVFQKEVYITILEPYRYPETIIAKLDVKTLCLHQPGKIIINLFMVH